MTQTLVLWRAIHGTQDGLTPYGQIQTVAAAARLSNDKIKPNLILHSPQPKDVETATCLVQWYRAMGNETCQAREDASLSGSRYKISSLLDTVQQTSTVFLVGAQPDIENAIAHMLNRPIFRLSNALAFVMEKTATYPGAKDWRVAQELWPQPVV